MTAASHIQLLTSWRVRLAAAGAFALAFAAPVPVRAQSAESMPGRIEVAAGVLWSGGASFGSRDATETTGAGGTFRLFSVATELASVTGVEARVAVRVARSIEAEPHGSYSIPDLRSDVTFDAESSNAPIVITAPVKRFEIGGDAVWYPMPRSGGRLRVFVAGGASFVRQLEDSGTVVVSGTAYDAGGGAKLLLTTRPVGWWKAIGARVDARAVVKGSQLSLDNRMHVFPTVSASLFVRF